MSAMFKPFLAAALAAGLALFMAGVQMDSAQACNGNGTGYDGCSTG